MSVTYYGKHSIIFIKLEGSGSYSYHSWKNMHLIPASKPYIASPEPKIDLIEIPGRNTRIDLTDFLPGGLTYGPRQGEWEFIVDPDFYTDMPEKNSYVNDFMDVINNPDAFAPVDWTVAYNGLNFYFDGSRFALYLDGDPYHIYTGRVYLSNFENEDDYALATLHYDLEPEIVEDGFHKVIFMDGDIGQYVTLREDMVMHGSRARYYGPPPSHLGYEFTGWDPSINMAITFDTTFIATYNQAFVTIVFEDYDGTVLKTQTLSVGSMPTPPSDPIREGYTFDGWSPSVTTATSDRVYVAKYVQAMTYYTVNFVDYNGSVLKSESLLYGSIPTPPSDPSREGYSFSGWSPPIGVVHSNVAYTATYIRTASDFYDVNTRINNGTYSTFYNIGDVINVHIKNSNTLIYEGEIQVAGIDKDVDLNGNTIPMTFVAKFTLPIESPNQGKHAMNSTLTSTGGYASSNLKSFIDNIENYCLESIDDNSHTLKDMLVSARKSTYSDGQTTNLYLKVWLLSYREIVGGNSFENSGISYSDGLFTGSNSRIRLYGNSGSESQAARWWTRSTRNNTGSFMSVSESGGMTSVDANGSYSVVFGFCVKGV